MFILGITIVLSIKSFQPNATQCDIGASNLMRPDAT